MSIKPISWALGLLAVAFPATAHAVLAVLTVVALSVLAHPTGACAAAAGALLASKLPALRRAARVRRSLRWGWAV